MKTKKLNFSAQAAEILEVSGNPLVTVAKFIFTDDLPNENSQGIPFEEFGTLAESAIGMPVKINFMDDYFEAGSTNHPGAYPIGHISRTSIEDLGNGSHRLVGFANIWNAEFPQEVKWLKEKMADAEAGKGEAPGLSWEVKYQQGIVKDGIEWLKGVVAQAATFVKFPAYGTRTSLLALASIQEPENNKEEVSQVLMSLAEQLVPKEQPKEKGGNQMTEEEAKQLKESAEASQKEVERLTTLLAEKEGEVTTLTEQVASLQKAALIDTRVKKYTELVGALPEEAAQAETKKELFVSFSEAQFDAWIDELVAVKKAATPAAPANAAAAARQAMASLQVPRLNPSESPQTNLRAELKGLARPNSV